MMVESRLQGSIDQIDKLIQFETGNCLPPSARPSYPLHLLLELTCAHFFCLAPDGGSLNLWDKHIEGACHTINVIVENLGTKYPQFIQS